MNVISEIIIDADIVDPNQLILKKGMARGLLRLEISITDVNLQKLISAYPSYYGTLKNALSYSGLSMRNSAKVTIALVFGQQKYQAILKTPEKQKDSWIPSGPVYDKSNYDIKLAGALCQAGFPIKQWTTIQTNLRLPKPRPIDLKSIQFEVTAGIWKYLRWPPSVGQDRGLTKGESCHSYSVCYHAFYHVVTSILHCTGVHFRWCPVTQ